MAANKHSLWRLLAGIAAANLVAAGVLGGYALFFHSRDALPPGAAQIVIGTIYPNLLLVPLLMGFVGAWFWRPLQLSIRDSLFCALITAAVSLTAAFGFWAEGMVCLLIVSPIFFATLLAGVLIGRTVFRVKGNGRVQLSIIPLLLVAILAEGRLAAEQMAIVTDRVTIDAPPSEVWKYVVAFPRITVPPNYWLNKVGLPSAAETTCEGEFIGARRECIFSNGIVFKEVVAEIEPGRLLTFDIVEQPNDPELLGHVTLDRGQFELQANGDGRTTLLGRSWYTLHVRPLWYFDWWTRDITREVHLRVMNHIKQLAEERR